MPLLSVLGHDRDGADVHMVHFPIDRPGIIGMPVPGVELKLEPSGRQARDAGARAERHAGLLEASRSAPRRPSTRRGFSSPATPVRFADPRDPAKGVVFDGRIAENFKLSTGTWVNVGGAAGRGARRRRAR